MLFLLAQSPCSYGIQCRSQNEPEEAMPPETYLLRCFAGALYQFQLFDADK